MKLSRFFRLQATLDQHIKKRKGLEDKDLLLDKIQALQVELGELANEWRGFKFWSEDREPRGYNLYLEGNGVEQKNPLLEEYVDGLHFFLSIGNDLNINENMIFNKSGIPNARTLFALINRYVAEMWWEYHDKKSSDAAVKWFHAFEHYLQLGEVLGFAWEEVEEAYLKKNKVNHERQESGY